MQHLPNAVLVDVRTTAEPQFVGMVPNALCIEWRTYPGMNAQSRFYGGAGTAGRPGLTLMLMCRSGVRSDEAARAAVRAGSPPFTTCSKVLRAKWIAPASADTSMAGKPGVCLGCRADRLLMFAADRGKVWVY